MADLSDITMLTYIEESPAQMTALLERRDEYVGALVDAFCAGDYASVWLVACGSSSNASACARPFMRKYLGREVSVVNPTSFCFAEFEPPADVFCPVISQSGCSTNSVEALDHARALGRLAVGITGNANSDFKDHADLLVDYGVGSEYVGYVTKGVTTLAEFLMLFALEVARREARVSAEEYADLIAQFARTPELHCQMQAEAKRFYAQHEKELTSLGPVYSVGFGQGYGVCCEGALKIGETVKVPSFAYEAEEFAHGPNLQLTPAYTVFFVDDFGPVHERLYQIFDATCAITDRAFFVTDDARVDDAHALRAPADRPAERLLSPLYVLPAFQLIAYLATTALDSWAEHPLMRGYHERFATKTETIKDVMPLL